VTRTRRFDFGSGPDGDPAYQWDSKRKLLSLAEVCALPSAVLIESVNTIKAQLHHFVLWSWALMVFTDSIADDVV